MQMVKNVKKNCNTTKSEQNEVSEDRKKRFNRGGVILYVKAQYIKIKELIFARVELEGKKL